MLIVYVVQFFVILFQVFLVYKTYDLYFVRRYKYKYSVEMAVAIVTILANVVRYYQSLASDPLLYFGLYFLILLSSIILFKGKIISKAVMMFLVFATITATELLATAIIVYIANVDISLLHQQGYARLIPMIFSQLLLFYAHLIITKRVNKEKYNLENNDYYIVVSTVLLISLIINIIVIWMYGNSYSYQEFVAILLALTILVALLSIFTILMTTKIMSDMEKKHKMELELQHIKLESNYVADVNAALEEIRILKHDMRGELALIHGYNELNQKEKIRSHIEKKLSEMEVFLLPEIDDDRLITSFLNFKIKEAKSKNISVDFQSNLAKGIHINIDEEDICRILNNVINNAIEALESCETKYIKLFMGLVNDYFLIVIENPYSGTIKTDGNQIITIKEDKSKHGYGIKSIKNIADKYDGMVNIDYDNNIFKVHIELLNKKLQKI